MRPHPRLLRYLAVVRDVPVRNSDLYLPARSIASVMPRYLLADSSKEPLDNFTWNKDLKGIAAPSFRLGLDIINELRMCALLPDETRLDFPSLFRILSMTTQTADVMQQNMKAQSKRLGLDLEEYSEEISSILNDLRYPSLDGYSDPGCILVKPQCLSSEYNR